MRYSFGSLSSAALGMLLLMGCIERSSDGTDRCQAPLSDYCSGSACPTWDEAIADAREFAAGNCNGDWSASSGRCGEYLYVLKVTGIGTSTTQYFNASGVLVALKEETDTPSYCNETSFDLWYGPILDCELEQGENFCYPEDGS